METDCDRLVRYEVSKSKAGPVKPKVEESLVSRSWWSMVSKAAERSRRTRADILRLSIARRRSF